jgi:hypothetical protein
MWFFQGLRLCNRSANRRRSCSASPREQTQGRASTSLLSASQGPSDGPGGLFKVAGASDGPATADQVLAGADSWRGFDSFIPALRSLGSEPRR